MSRNGSGTYSLPGAYNPVVTNTPITIAWANNTLTDIATALTNSLACNGETTVTANLPMSGFIHTGVGTATLRNQYPSWGQVQDSGATWGGTAGGTADALTITLTPVITAYAAGQRFEFIVGASPNATTTPTLAVNGLSAIIFKRKDGTTCAAGDLPANMRIGALYNGTNMLLDYISPVAPTFSGNTTVTTINKVTITTPATGATLTISDGKTFTASDTTTIGTNSITFAGGEVVTFTATNALTFTTTGSTNVTLPTSGTLIGTAPGSNKNVLTSNGSSWTSAAPAASTIVRSARTSNTILAGADAGTLIDITSGTFSQTFTAAATLGNGWFCWIRNSGTGDITLDPNASEQIDSLTTFVMYPQECRFVTCDGAAFYSEVVHPFYRKATSTFTHVMPPGYLEIEVDSIGGAGQGGSGRRGAAGTVRSGGAPGGAPSRVIRKLRNIAAGTSTTVTIGAGGTTGGAAITVDNTSGNDGQAGGNTTFGSLVTAYGGAAGKGGATGNCATSGSGSLGVGVSTNTGAATLGGLPALASERGSGSTSFYNNYGEGGGGGTAASAAFGGNTEYGGAGSGAFDTTGTSTIPSAGSSIFGVSAAGHGGWITASDTLPASAGRAGLNGTFANGGGATGGTCGASPTVGTNGTAAATDDVCGGPGGGGGSTITGGQTGKAGGNGAAPGGPGGGGGAVLNGQNSGAGGTGANGQCVIKGIV